MSIRIYNTLARAKQIFEPLNPSRVTVYVCGPTVYNRAHIGNFRPAVVFDTLFRLLRAEYGEPAVVYARNITDIEDKIIARAVEDGAPISDITEKYAAIYNEDLADLNVLPPTIEPWATGHISEMIEMMEALQAKGHAYQTPSGLFFEVATMEDYGKLSRRPRDEQIAGARVEVAEEKRDPADFALWKTAKPDEPQDAQFDSPWGRGRPGWHIECSAMAKAHLGETIDIHAGGIDLQFPHHENEIAQSECANGAPFARYWMHNGFLDMGGEKMSKSLGNVVLLNDLKKAWPGEAIRLALLSAHYRAPLDWSEDLLTQSKATLDRAYGALRRVWGDGSDDAAEEDAAFRAALSDDLNTPEALAEFARLVGEANKAADGEDGTKMDAARARLLKAGAYLGLLRETPEAWEQGGDSDDRARIDGLVEARVAARAAKDWAEADRIRDALAAEGVEIMDGPDGSTWRKV
ncbi:MAG: cysteine--tRNA ligase [Pseudomonadota bacterium]